MFNLLTLGNMCDVIELLGNGFLKGGQHMTPQVLFSASSGLFQSLNAISWNVSILPTISYFILKSSYWCIINMEGFILLFHKTFFCPNCKLISVTICMNGPTVQNDTIWFESADWRKSESSRWGCGSCADWIMGIHFLNTTGQLFVSKVSSSFWRVSQGCYQTTNFNDK